MEIKTLNKAIELINNIYSTMQFDYILEIQTLLKINITDNDIKKIQYTKLYNKTEDIKDIYTYIIINYIEKLLNEEEQKYFHQSLNNYLIRFTSNETIKKEQANNMIKNQDTTNLKQLIRFINDDEYILQTLCNNNLDLKDQIILVIAIKNNDEIKEKYLERTNDPYLIYNLIISIKDDNKKLMLFEKYKDILDEEDKTIEDILPTLNNDEIKIKYLIDNAISKTSYKKIMYTLQNEESYLRLWQYSNLKNKEIIIYSLKDPNLQVKYIKELDKETNTKIKSSTITQVIQTLPIELIKDITLNCQNIEFDICEILPYVNDQDYNIELIKKYGNKKTCMIIRKNQILHSDIIIKNIDLFLEKEEVQDKDKIKEYITQMYITNNDIVHTINWNLLQDKYVKTLGLEKINIIGSFTRITDILLKLNDIQYEVFYKCLNHYITKNNDFDWNNAAYQIIRELYFGKIDNNDITQYIEDINTINLDNLLHILLNGDSVKVKSQEDINNYHKLLIEKSDKQFNEEDISRKKDAIFLKAFGLTDYTSLLRGFREQTKKGIGSIYDSYKSDINLIENEEIKKLFNFIRIVLESTSIEQLTEIYNQIKIRKLDTYKLESLLKNEYLKLYNKTLLNPNTLIQDEYGLYDAGVDFNIITTSVGAYHECTPTNYQEDWNRPSLASPHFCTSYIRNDMLGTAPVNNVLYGFSNMAQDSLVLSGANDIYSTGASITSKAEINETYYGPDNQINNTPLSKHKYNEMDFKRIQNGRKKQPDYILVFKKDGIIENI